MAAKLVILLIILALVLSVAILGSFYYFKKRAEYKHEKEMFKEKKRAQLDEQALNIAEDETSIDAELESETE